MLQSLVDVEGRDKFPGVTLQVDDELRESLPQRLRQNHEEKGQVVFHVADVRFGEVAETKSVVGEENEDGVVEMSQSLHVHQQPGVRVVSFSST